jgi:hypothetical protein
MNMTNELVGETLDDGMEMSDDEEDTANVITGVLDELDIEFEQDLGQLRYNTSIQSTSANHAIVHNVMHDASFDRLMKRTGDDTPE